MQDNAYLARQPIVDKQQKIIGYELLFCRSGEAGRVSFTDDHLATSKILTNILGTMGTEWLLGDKLAFINTSTSLLMSDFLKLLPSDRVVPEIQGHTQPTPELLARCHKLRTRGFRLVLDNFELTPESEPLLEIASFIKLDIRKLQAEGKLEAHVQGAGKISRQAYR